MAKSNPKTIRQAMRLRSRVDLNLRARNEYLEQHPEEKEAYERSFWDGEGEHKLVKRVQHVEPLDTVGQWLERRRS